MAAMLLHEVTARPRVLRLQTWPGGFCPLHVLEGMTCNRGCTTARRQLAQVAEDLDLYWQSPSVQRDLANERRIGCW